MRHWHKHYNHDLIDLGTLRGNPDMANRWGIMTGEPVITRVVKELEVLKADVIKLKSDIASLKNKN